MESEITDFSISPDLWHIVRERNQIRVTAKNSTGSYLLTPPSEEKQLIPFLKKFTDVLNPKSINEALDGSMEGNRCTCTGGEGRPRCQHLFTYAQVCELRGQYYMQADRVGFMASQLKAKPKNNKLPRSEGERDWRIHYYLADRPVCRGFFRSCLDLSNHECGNISREVRGLSRLSRLHNVLPTYKEQETQHAVCMGFWREFFGDYCQSSYQGHRYFPVNLSHNYIYLNNFWAWYRDIVLKNYEDEDDRKSQAALSEEQVRLAAAIKPIVEPKIGSPEYVRAIYQNTFRRGVVERKEEESMGNPCPTKWRTSCTTWTMRRR